MNKNLLLAVMAVSLAAPQMAQAKKILGIKEVVPTEAQLALAPDLIAPDDADGYDPKDPMVEYEEALIDAEIVTEKWNNGTLFEPAAGCKRITCLLWLQISKKLQRAFVYEKGTLIATWPVSTGTKGHSTPNFEVNAGPRAPGDRKMSNKYPGKNYIEPGTGRKLGNMPYAVKISGPYYVHGTNAIANLGKVASHGCIRLHPNNAKIFNRLVAKYGSADSWISVNNEGDGITQLTDIWNLVKKVFLFS